jgi:hypothetical protein
MGFIQLCIEGLPIGAWGCSSRIGELSPAQTPQEIYNGRYSESDQNLQFDLTLTVPPGVTLVQGTKASPTEYAIRTRASVPKRALRNSEPVLVELPPGPVNIIFRYVRELQH